MLSSTQLAAPEKQNRLPGQDRFDLYQGIHLTSDVLFASNPDSKQRFASPRSPRSLAFWARLRNASVVHPSFSMTSPADNGGSEGVPPSDEKYREEELLQEHKGEVSSHENVRQSQNCRKLTSAGSLPHPPQRPWQEARCSQHQRLSQHFGPDLRPNPPPAFPSAPPSSLPSIASATPGY